MYDAKKEEHFIVIRLSDDGGLADLDLAFVDVTSDGCVHISSTAEQSNIVGLQPRAQNIDLNTLRLMFGALERKRRRAA